MCFKCAGVSGLLVLVLRLFAEHAMCTVDALCSICSLVC